MGKCRRGLPAVVLDNSLRFGGLDNCEKGGIGGNYPISGYFVPDLVGIGFYHPLLWLLGLY